MQILNALPNHFLLVNPILMILTLTLTKNTSRLDFVSISKGLMELTNYTNPIVYTKQSDNEGVAAIFVSKLKAITKKTYNDYYARNQNHSNLQNKNERSLIKQSFAIFVRKNI